MLTQPATSCTFDISGAISRGNGKTAGSKGLHNGGFGHNNNIGNPGHPPSPHNNGGNPGNQQTGHTRCQGWNYGYSGTFDCSAGYDGATRFCESVTENGYALRSWNEEGCATGVTASDGAYCVQNCGGFK